MSARYSAGEILLAALVFSSQAGTKKRPVLVICDGADDDLLVVPITSHTSRSIHDIFLNDWRQSGLRLPSIVRLEKFATIEKAAVIRLLGQISPGDRGQLKPALQRLLEGIVSGW